jgi:hypothetical protein
MSTWIAARTGVQLPSPPAFARNVVKSEGCRAVASRRRRTVLPRIKLLRATARQASKGRWAVSLMSIFCKAKATQATSTRVARAISVSDWIATIAGRFRTQRSGSRGESKPTSHFRTLRVPLISSITSNPRRAERFSKSTSSYRLTVLNNPRRLSGLPRRSKRRRATFETFFRRSKRLRVGRQAANFVAESKQAITPPSTSATRSKAAADHSD